MSERPKHTLLTHEFKGRVSNANPHLLPLGAAQEEINMRHGTAGQLNVRPGCQPVTFGNAISAVADEIISIYSVPMPLGQYVVYETSAGDIKCGINPTL